MNPFETLTAGTDADWLIFSAILLVVMLLFFSAVIWLKVLRKPGNKSHYKHRKHRHRPTNPTLAETGGLPPIRPAGQPPRGV
jgi:cbb3-type cytochrome oxidase subunit 3